MKYLQDYKEEEQTQIFKQNGAYFCFSKEQFEEKKKENVKYISLGAGLVCPEKNAKKLIAEIDANHLKGIQKDIADNGKKAIIRRELFNYESFYTNDISSCVEALEGYKIDRLEIAIVYREILNSNPNGF
jgi:hypothetical protein